MYVAYLLLLGFGIIVNSYLIILLYGNRQKNFTVVSLMLLLIQVNIWFIPKVLTNLMHAQGHLFETLSRISALGYIFVPVTFLIFCLLYGLHYKIFQYIYFWILLLIPPLIFLYLSWTSNTVGVHEASLATFYPWGYETPTGPLWSIYMFWYDSIMLVAIGLLVYNYHTLVDHIRKRQSFYIILAVVIPLLVATITTGVLPLFNIFVFPVGLILAFMMTIIGVTIIYHYGLFEVTPFAILSSLNHVIITVDNHGNVLQMNPYSEELLQVKLPHIVGKPLEKYLLVKDKKNKASNIFRDLVSPVISKGKSKIVDTYSILNKNKQLFATSASITPIFSEDDGVVGANIFLRDNRQELEREKQKNDYFSILSHELKTPITSIKAYTELLLKVMPQQNEKNRQYVKKIDHNLNRLTRLINDSLELSRLTSGKFNINRQFFEIDEFIRGIVETLTLNYKDRALRIHGEGKCVVFADKDRIEQVIINFITNAIKFSAEDKEIIIHLYSDAKNITIGVQDFGRGIDTKYHKRIFDRFYQVDSSNNSNKGGLGIGLYIAGVIIKAHGGKIWVESQIGKGSTFYFSLPTSHLENGPRKH